MFATYVVLGALLAFTSALPSDYVVHEKRHGERTPVRRSRVASDHVIPIRIALKEGNLDKGYDLLMDVSHPKSVNYGKHYTKEQVNALFAPSEESIQSVKEWLYSAGVLEDSVSLHEKGWLSMELPASHAEKLFQTEYYEHQSENGHVRLGCDQYKLPEHIAAHVDYIKPGVALSPPLQLRKRANGPAFQAKFGPTGKPWNPPPGKVDLLTTDAASSNAAADDTSNCGKIITPACIGALYAIPVASSSDDTNLVGIYQNEPSYSQDDLNGYFSTYAQQIPADTGPQNDDINGATSPTDAGNANPEANIDFEMVYGLIYPEQTVLFQDDEASAPGDDETFLTAFLDNVDGSFCSDAESSAGYQCGAVSITPVVSISYGQVELALPQAAQVKSCNEIMKLSMQGTTFVLASGDYGVASSPDTANGFNGCYNPSVPGSNNGTVFSPGFPSNCPYVLSVGGTQIPSGGEVSSAEEVMFQIGNSFPNIGLYFSSGGGFANYFAAPDYQSDALNTYFANNDPGYATYTYNGNDLFSGNSNIGSNGGVYNRAGRGFPDVSANGGGFAAYSGGHTFVALGTSLSAPLWASIISLLNQHRTAAGKGPVGFVNPTLYANPQAFHDITSGSNPGCATNGFTAVAGWDPVTGLGTPNFAKLLEIFADLP